MKIFEIGINDGEYPKLLKETSDPPEKIYACGNLDLLNDKMISIVGSRKCSEYGKNVAYKLGEQLANNGVTVVSGLALGIDSFAHRGALNGEGKTIAVLACGIDQYYPMQNHSLQDRIYKEGLIISEKPGNYKAKNYDFPRRNRIIAGLSLGTCIVEAAVKSGSLITASFALNENRQVYAVPGNITNMQSFGANQLIKEGALCVTGFNDILYDLGINPEQNSNDLKDLSPEEKNVYLKARELGECTLEDLAFELKKAVYDINGLVTILEIKGYFRTSLGKITLAK